MAPSRTKGAVRPSARNPAVKVVVFQCPQGCLPISLCPLGQRPWLRTILVLVPVSSMNTSRLAASPASPLFRRGPAEATWGRSCSAALGLFFEVDAMAREEAADRAVGGRNPKLVEDP